MSFGFFSPPDGGPDLPWHCMDDLECCLGIPRAIRRVMRSKYRERGWPKATVATKDGILNIAPHFVAQGWIDGMTTVGDVPATIRNEYDQAGAAALEQLTALLPFSFGEDAWFQWMKAARKRHER
jgi:hypothetical protein